MSSPFDAVSAYFFAKDGNRPHLMRRSFAENAELKTVVKTDAMSLPQSATGVVAIEDILVRQFADNFENIYTFGLTRPRDTHRHHFPCYWLAGMSAKRSGSIRIGCGRYDWYFTTDERCLIKRLVITIDVMSVLPETELHALMAWLSSLPYPWCTPEEAVPTMPSKDGLAVVNQYLSQIRSTDSG